jgi:hypothetical protein
MAGDVKSQCEVKCQPQFFRYASFRESSNYIHMNQHTGSQGTPEPDFRVDWISHRRADWAIPRFGSACARVDELLDSDVSCSLQASCWVWDRERPNLMVRLAISVWTIWKIFHLTGSDEDFWVYQKSKIQSWRAYMTLQSWCNLLERHFIG